MAAQHPLQIDEAEAAARVPVDKSDPPGEALLGPSTLQSGP